MQLDANLPIDLSNKPTLGAISSSDSSVLVALTADPTNKGLNVNILSGSTEIEGDVAHDAADSGNPVKVGGRARTSQITAVANNDRADAVFNAYGERVIAGFIWATTKSGVTESDPLSKHHVEETLVNLTNIAANTTAYAYTDWDGYTIGSFQGETSGTTPTDVLTVTLEATNQDDGTAPASCTYQDRGLDLFGVASWIDEDFWLDIDTLHAMKYSRIKYNTSNTGGSDADLTIFSKLVWS